MLKERLDDAQLAAYLDNFSHFSMAYSWGGFESLILANQPEELEAIRPAGGVDFSGTLVRLHIGLENVEDPDRRSGGRFRSPQRRALRRIPLIFFVSFNVGLSY